MIFWHTAEAVRCVNMPTVLDQQDLRQCRRLDFCYLCGDPVLPGTAANRDHVPPKSVFSSAGRAQPLVLPTHRACNEIHSINDERVGQLLSVLHGKYPAADRLRLTFSVHPIPGSTTPAGAVQNVPFGPIAFRWIRGFHAALYEQYLPSCGGYIHPPFPEGKTPQTIKPVFPIQLEYVKTIKKNRIARNTDQVVCWNEKCRYECVWARTDEGIPMCIFALDVYGWDELGDIHHFPRRSCVGIYMPSAGIPLKASVDTPLEFPFSNEKVLDAFGE